MQEDTSAWNYSTGSPVVNLRSIIITYPHMLSDLSDVAPATASGIVGNYQFVATSASLASPWEGNWYSGSVLASSYTRTYPVGFMLNPYSTNLSAGRTAYSKSLLTSSSLTDLSYAHVVSGSFTLISGSEYSTSIRFYSDNGYIGINSSSALPDEEDSYRIEISGCSIEVDVENPSYKYLPNTTTRYTLEADYGAIIAAYTTGSTPVFCQVIASNRGRTTNEINSYSTETNDPYNKPVWKNYKSSFVPEGFTGTATGRLYIYNRHVKIPSPINNVWARPYVHADYAVVTPSKPYIIQSIGSSSSPVSMDSYEYFEAESPEVYQETQNMLLDANIDYTTTACQITVSGSTTTGSHRPGVDAGNDSYTLEFGKDEDGVMWSSWIPFYPYHYTAFKDLTEGIHITSACLVMTATEDVISTPSKTCYVTAGLEKTKVNTNPSFTGTYSSISSRTLANPVNTGILNSWALGEKYYIDITDSLKEQIGKKAIYWGYNTSASPIAVVVKNNNSTVGGYREIASGSHLAYDPPQLSINYVRNGISRNAMGLTIRNYVSADLDYGDLNHYSSNTILIGGNTGNLSRGIFYFDLTSLPSGSISSASLSLYQIASSYTVANQTLTLYPVNKKWDFYGVTWKRAFGAGDTGDWASGGGDYYTGSACGSFTAGVVEGWTEKTITLSATGITALNNQKSSSTPNCGFILKGPENVNNWAYFLSGNYTSIPHRPKLSVVVDGVTYHIQYTGPSEDVSAPPAQPPDTPAPTTVGLLGYQYRTENTTFANVAITGAANSKRYLLVTQGFGLRNNVYTGEVEYTSLTFNGQPMTPIVGVCGHNNNTFPEGSNEACLVTYGYVIPDSLAPGNYTISGVRKRNGAVVSSAPVTLFIREFNGVNSTTPIAGSVVSRNGANNALSTNPISIPYVAKGYVAADVFLDELDEGIGLPQCGTNQTATKPSVFARGFSHITTIPATSGGTTSPSFSWTSDSWMWTAEGLKIKKGSDNVIAAISLNPNIE